MSRDARKSLVIWQTVSNWTSYTRPLEGSTIKEPAQGAVHAVDRVLVRHLGQANDTDGPRREIGHIPSSPLGPLGSGTDHMPEL